MTVSACSFLCAHRGNFFHEIGHFQKQVSCYFQAQSAGTILESNICFNGPRAGFNFNDGMGGGDVIKSNVIFNMVRETQDHGTFNSWDRQPFFNATGDGGYAYPYRDISNNFWINNYNPQEATDNDDGSAYYKTHDNFFPFSRGGLKGDFGGHDNHHYNNVYINEGGCMGITAQLAGHEDLFCNNTCLMTVAGESYAVFQGSGHASGGVAHPAAPTMHDNKVFTPDGAVSVQRRSGPDRSTWVTTPLEEWQALGHDVGTTAATFPSDAVVIQMARGVLKM